MSNRKLFHIPLLELRQCQRLCREMDAASASLRDAVFQKQRDLSRTQRELAGTRVQLAKLRQTAIGQKIAYAAHASSATGLGHQSGAVRDPASLKPPSSLVRLARNIQSRVLLLTRRKKADALAIGRSPLFDRSY
jgi:hypothetical protein